jgi:hypothetical protein
MLGILQNTTLYFIVLVPKNYLAFQSSILSVIDEGYSRNGSCALNLISTFLLQKINYLATPGLKNIYYCGDRY